MTAADSLEDSVGVPIECTPYREMKWDILSKIREHCHCSLNSFPGAHPVTLNLQNARQLGAARYVVAEKSDGVRILVYFTSELMFLVDRREFIFVLDCVAPLAGLPRDSSGAYLTQNGTVLDCELVLERYEDGSSEKCLLVFDAIAVNGENITNCGLLERLKYAKHSVVTPYRDLRRRDAALVTAEKKRHAYVPLYVKDVFEIWHLEALHSMCGRMYHNSDGFVFTPVDTTYKGHYKLKILKWKPPHLNTIDFFATPVCTWVSEARDFCQPAHVLLMINKNGARVPTEHWLRPGLGNWAALLSHPLFASGKLVVESFLNVSEKSLSFPVVPRDEAMRLLAELRGEAKPQNAGSELDAEPDEPRDAAARAAASAQSAAQAAAQKVQLGFCQQTSTYYNLAQPTETEGGGWVVERVRSDKLTPNEFFVMQRIIQSLRENITYENLLARIRAITPGPQNNPAMRAILPDYYPL